MDTGRPRRSAKLARSANSVSLNLTCGFLVRDYPRVTFTPTGDRRIGSTGSLQRLGMVRLGGEQFFKSAVRPEARRSLGTSTGAAEDAAPSGFGSLLGETKARRRPDP